jgi:hypothetical protein
MAYSDVKAVILTHATAAGAALTVPLLDVAIAFPLPADRRVRVYYGGEADPAKMGGRWTLNSEMVGKVTLIAAFWAINALNEDLAVVIDAEMEAFGHELRTRLDGDAQLGGRRPIRCSSTRTRTSSSTARCATPGSCGAFVSDYVEYTRAA